MSEDYWVHLMQFLRVLPFGLACYAGGFYFGMRYAEEREEASNGE